MPFIRTLLPLLLIVSISNAAELVTLDGKKSSGEIVSVDAKELVFKTASGNETHELTKLSAIEISNPKNAAVGAKIEVETVDGSKFRCEDFKIKKDVATLTLLNTKLTFDVPLSRVLYMVRDLSDPKHEQAFRGILSKRGKRDIWVVLKPDNSLDGLTGTFGDGDAKGENINFEMEANAQKLSIQMSRIYAMILNPETKELGQTVCKVIDANANILYAKSLTVTAKKTVEIETVTGAKIEYPNMGSLAKLDFSEGSQLYLSNAAPIKVEQTSTEGIPEPYRRDRNLDNGELKIRLEDTKEMKFVEQKFDKGLALHSRTVLTYDLGGKYKLFQTVAGVDVTVEGESNATLIIEGDFKPIFKGVITKAKPQVLNLSVLNVKQLRITVESEFLDLGNQVNLGNARVLK